jgi:membrane fusion protein, heavy metal efflux system
MFGTATFHGQKKEKFSAVPATAILHLHDRDWIYEPLGGNKFKRVEVKAGDMLPLGMQLILSGVAPGLRLVANALEFQNTSEQ